MDKFETENLAFGELAEQIQDVIRENPVFKEKFYLYFWLRASKFNVGKAENMIRETMLWRRDNEVDKLIKEEFNPELLKEFTVTADGKTKTGFLAITMPAGKYRFSKSIGKHGKEVVFRQWIQRMAKSEVLTFECHRQANRHRENNGCHSVNWSQLQKSWVIADMNDLDYFDSASKDAISVILSISKMTARHFPALEGTVCIINAGKMMELLLKLVKPLFKGTNVEFVVFDTNSAKWTQFIREHIDAGQLPLQFGGTKPMS